MHTRKPPYRFKTATFQFLFGNPPDDVRGTEIRFPLPPTRSKPLPWWVAGPVALLGTLAVWLVFIAFIVTLVGLVL